MVAARREEMAPAGRVPLIRRECRRCRATFGVCHRDFRGQRYCSERCRRDARSEGHREANRKHQRSPEGRDDHRDRQREYVKRLKEQGMTDERCTLESQPRSLANEEHGHEATAAGRAWRWPSAAPPWCIVCRRPGYFVEPSGTGRDPARRSRSAGRQACVRAGSSGALPMASGHAHPRRSV